MFGLEGVAVPLGFILTILSAILCIVYGVINWNKGYVTEEELEQETVWKAEQSKVKDKL
ncbi:MAG: hypothetical protein OCC45_05810 [Desulfotalea sp.]